MRTLGAIWSDKPYAVDSWLEALGRLELDRAQWRLLILCRATLPEVVGPLRQYADSHRPEWGELTFAQCPCPTPEGGRRRRRAMGLSFRMLNEARDPGSDMVVWEDDIIPAPGAIAELLAVAELRPDAWQISAVQYSREHDGQVVAWRSGGREPVFGPDDECQETVPTHEVTLVDDERPAGVEPMAATGTGLCWFSHEFLDRGTLGTPEQGEAHDPAAGREINAAGKKVLLRWDTNTMHVGPEKVYASEQCDRSFRVDTWAGAPALDRLDDTALILTHYGQQPARVAAVKRALPRVLNGQDPLPRVLFLELLFPGEETAFPELSRDERVEHHLYTGREVHRDLMQKEALMNLAAGLAGPAAQYLIFCDADAYCLHERWLADIRDKLVEHPDNLVQGFSHFADTLEPRLAAPAAATRKRAANGSWAPGLCWGITRDFFERMGGWNPWCICGSGDHTFVSEHFAERLDQGYYRAGWLDQVIRRDQPKGRLTYVDHDIVHEYHGPFRERAYRWSRVLIDCLGQVQDYVALDRQGLVAWYDPQCILRRTLARKAELVNEKVLDRVIDEERGCRRMPCIDGAEFAALAAERDSAYSRDRWEYMRQARLMVESIAGWRMLEVGPRRIPLGRGGWRMDIEDYGLFPTQIHDAGVAPWPYDDDTMDVVVMLQVLEHLQGRQREAWAEVRRVGRWAVVSVPYKWPEKAEPGHGGIDETTLQEWTGQNPKRFAIVGEAPFRRLVAKYNLEQ